jgi:hypothetical protein
MNRRRHGRCARWAALVLAVGLLAGCDWRVTREKPTFDQLDSFEKSTVEIVLEELQAFNQQVESRTSYSINAIIDRERINVSFEGIIFAANLGDEIVHVAVWDNLSESQKQLVQSWFAAPSREAAKQSYERFFYRFMAVSQGVKQYMYEVLTVEWVFGNRSIYNVERDSARIALAHYATIDPSRDMWDFMDSTCSALLQQYESTYGPTFGKKYLRDNFQQLVGDGRTPTGYMYYLCRFVEMGREAAVDLDSELQGLQQLRPR